MRVDEPTLVTMVNVWGRPYIPTLLRPQGAETPNTLPLSVIAEQMQRFGLGVDVDVIAQGRRTASDSYGQFYATLLADRPAAGQRTTVLVIRMDTRSPDTTAGLMWRTDTAAAVAAATRRITRALRQNGCRAEPMTAADMRQAVLDMHGGSKEDIASPYREGWRDLTHRGAHVTSYYLSAQDLTPERLDDMWAIASDHTLLALHLRRTIPCRSAKYLFGGTRVGNCAVHYRTTTVGATCGHPQPLHRAAMVGAFGAAARC